MSLEGREITVLGAGIAGLAVATALGRRGARVRVLERAPAIAEVGAGLQVSPNGAVVLEALGLGSALAKAGVEGVALSMREGETGREVFRMGLSRPGRSYRFLHRADLIDLLHGAAREAGAEIVTGCPVSAVEPSGQGVALRLEGGGVEHADLLIGADGVKSVARKLLEDGGARFTGQVAWRMLVPAVDEEPPFVQLHMGTGRHLVRYPLRGGRLVNIVAVEERTEWAEEGWNTPDDPAAPLSAFAEFTPAIRADLERAQEVHLWGLFRHPVARRWHGEGVVLLGDAAHPTLPFLAQGANMALEDAWVLAACLDAEGEAGLARYQGLRRDRVARIIDVAERNARRYHMAPGPRRLAAHAALRLASTLAPGAVARPFEWLYGHDVTRDVR